MVLTSLKQKYEQEIVSNWRKEGQEISIHAVPRLTKVVLNMGLGQFKEDEKQVLAAAAQLETIAGQKPIVTRSKKSIAGFGVREGMAVGAKVTLRGKRMYQFLEKVFNYVLPRTRDFRGLSRNGFDDSGNYTFGLDDQLVFLEIDANKITKRMGLQITLVTTARNKEDAVKLVEALGTPFEKNE